MASRKDRLKKLLTLQERLQALHEQRHAGLLADAHAAGHDAADLMAHFYAENPVAGLFPELYAKRIEGALAAKEASLERAREEAGRVAAATARANLVGRAHRDASRQEERERGDRERLEAIRPPPGR